MSFSLLFFPAGRKGGREIGASRYRMRNELGERELMRIAVASTGLEVAPRFSQCTSYMCYTVSRGVIVECQNMPKPAVSGAKLVSLLSEIGVDVLIVGTIEYDIANLFCHAGVEVIAGASGSAREVAQGYLTRTLTGVDELCHLDDWDREDEPEHNLAEA